MATQYSRNQVLCIAALSILIGFGCAGSKLDLRPIPVTENPAQHLSSLSAQVSKAQEEGVDVLAPTWFSRARASLAAAKRLHEQGGSTSELLAKVAQGEAELEQARSFAQIVRTSVGNVIEARAAARSAGAPALGEPYDDAEKRFTELTAAVENDDLGWAQRKSGEVASVFRDLELSAIKETTLAKIRGLIKQAESDGAEKLVPTVLAAVKRQMRDLDAFITQNRYASGEMNDRAASTLFAANRLVFLTQRAKRVEKMSTEAVVLDEDKLLGQLAEAVLLGDIADTSIENRRNSVESAIDQLKTDRDFLVNRNELLRSEGDQLRAMIAQLEGLNSSEQERIARLEAERRFNQLYSEVSGFFDDEEAEVYKQDQRLVIRLRGVRFPVGKYVLGPESYPVLSKVQKAIRAFGTSQVTVEGHTDSTGSTAVNEQLSQLRADSVKEYLVANNTLPRQHISAVGKGPNEPLAPNTSAEGRALNRRIDIIIDARSGSMLPGVAAEGAE